MDRALYEWIVQSHLKRRFGGVYYYRNSYEIDVIAGNLKIGKYLEFLAKRNTKRKMNLKIFKVKILGFLHNYRCKKEENNIINTNFFLVTHLFLILYHILLLCILLLLNITMLLLIRLFQKNIVKNFYDKYIYTVILIKSLSTYSAYKSIKVINL